MDAIKAKARVAMEMGDCVQMPEFWIGRKALAWRSNHRLLVVHGMKDALIHHDASTHDLLLCFSIYQSLFNPLILT